MESNPEHRNFYENEYVLYQDIEFKYSDLLNNEVYNVSTHQHPSTREVMSNFNNVLNDNRNSYPSKPNINTDIEIMCTRKNGSICEENVVVNQDDEIEIEGT